MIIFSQYDLTSEMLGELRVLFATRSLSSILDITGTLLYKKLEGITHLNLASSRIENDSALAAAGAASASSSVDESLLTPQMFIIIARVASIVPSITAIDFSHNELGIHAIEIARNLAISKHLESLNLSVNKLGCNGTNVVQALSNSTSLQNLNLSDNNLGTFGANLGPHLSHLKLLQYLDLSNNNLGFKAVKLIEDLSSLDSFQGLSLSNNRLGRVEKALLENLTTLRSLKHLDLSGNRFSSKVEDLNTRIEKLSTLPLSQISINLLAGSSAEAATDIIELLQRLPLLTSLISNSLAQEKNIHPVIYQIITAKKAAEKFSKGPNEEFLLEDCFTLQKCPKKLLGLNPDATDQLMESLWSKYGFAMMGISKKMQVDKLLPGGEDDNLITGLYSLPEPLKAQISSYLSLSDIRPSQSENEVSTAVVASKKEGDIKESFHGGAAASNANIWGNAIADTIEFFLIQESLADSAASRVVELDEAELLGNPGAGAGIDEA